MSFPYLHLQQELLRSHIDGYFFANLLGAASRGSLAGLPLESKIQETSLISNAPWVTLTRYILEHRPHEVHGAKETLKLHTIERVYRLGSFLEQEESIEIYAHYVPTWKFQNIAPFYSTIEYRLDTPRKQELLKYKSLPALTMFSYRTENNSHVKQWELKFHPLHYSFSLHTLKLEIV